MTGRHANEQTSINTDRDGTDRQTMIHVNRQTDNDACKQTDRQ